MMPSGLSVGFPCQVSGRRSPKPARGSEDLRLKVDLAGFCIAWRPRDIPEFETVDTKLVRELEKSVTNSSASLRPWAYDPTDSTNPRYKQVQMGWMAGTKDSEMDG